MLNKIVVMGRFTKDPELRRTQNGTAVASFTLAVDRDFNREETDFVPVVAWKNTAEFAERYFSKGMTAIVAGRLQMREWTNREGERRKTAEVVADRIYFADSRREDAAGRTDDIRSYGESFDLEPEEGDDRRLPF